MHITSISLFIGGEILRCKKEETRFVSQCKQNETIAAASALNTPQEFIDSILAVIVAEEPDGDSHSIDSAGTSAV